MGHMSKFNLVSLVMTILLTLLRVYRNEPQMSSLGRIQQRDNTRLSGSDTIGFRVNGKSTASICHCSTDTWWIWSTWGQYRVWASSRCFVTSGDESAYVRHGRGWYSLDAFCA
jgi:hypothetical protein